MTSLQGYFLIAPPVVADENFNRSLVLILQHDEEGAIGLITNRPTNSELDNLWEAMTGSSFPGEGVLHVGGPVEGPVMVLHTRAEYSEQRILSGVYVSSQKSNLVKLISKKTLPYRVFAGYAGWQPGQLEAEIYATALGNVYTFGPTFRAENSNTSRHLAEFWMVEPEMAFCDLDGNMDLAEAFLKQIFGDVLEDCAEDMAFFNQHIDDTVLETLQGVVKSEFTRLSYTEAVDILVASEQKFDYQVEWGCDLQSEHERYLTEQHFSGPVILYDYPSTIKPFYMRVNDNGKTVRAMDVLVPKVGEIIGGSQREERLDVLEDRMRQQDLDPLEYWWYTDLRKYGTVPHAGFGLGLERAVQFATGMQNIRDVIPFPRPPGSAEF